MGYEERLLLLELSETNELMTNYNLDDALSLRIPYFSITYTQNMTRSNFLIVLACKICIHLNLSCWWMSQIRNTVFKTFSSLFKNWEITMPKHFLILIFAHYMKILPCLDLTSIIIYKCNTTLRKGNLIDNLSARLISRHAHFINMTSSRIT